LYYKTQKAEEEQRRKEEQAMKEEERKKAEKKLVEELENREKKKLEGTPLPMPVMPSAPPLQSTLIGDFPVPPTMGSIDASSIKNDISGVNRDHGTPVNDQSSIQQHNDSQSSSLYSLNTG